MVISKREEFYFAFTSFKEGILMVKQVKDSGEKNID